MSKKDRRILLNFVTHCYFAMGLFYRRGKEHLTLTLHGVGGQDEKYQISCG